MQTIHEPIDELSLDDTEFVAHHGGTLGSVERTVNRISQEAEARAATAAGDALRRLGVA